MQVSISQLVPGCVVVQDVQGKTHHPILPKNTAVTEQHILFLKKFLIPKVEVSSKLASGAPFIPKEIIEEEPLVETRPETDKNQGDFFTLYKQTVMIYKELFIRWQGNAAVDIAVIKKVIFPLIDLVKEVSFKELCIISYHSDKKDYFYHHAVATAVLSAFIADKSNFEDFRQVGLAGFLADCGMARVDSALFEKAAPLTLQEYEEVKKHPTYSYRLVEKIPSLPLKVKLGILQHHEKMDGTGYPIGVKQDKLHPYAKIIAIADMFHAMTTERYYQSRQSPFKVIEELQSEQFGKYDPELVQLFVSSLTNLTTGTKVMLSDKRKAEIVFMDGKSPTRPMVRLLDTMEIISLADKKELHIEALL